MILEVQRHVAYEIAVHDISPLDGLHVAEDRVVAEPHGALQDFCASKEP